MGVQFHISKPPKGSTLIFIAATPPMPRAIPEKVASRNTARGVAEKAEDAHAHQRSQADEAGYQQHHLNDYGLHDYILSLHLGYCTWGRTHRGQYCAPPFRSSTRRDCSVGKSMLSVIDNPLTLWGQGLPPRSARLSRLILAVYCTVYRAHICDMADFVVPMLQRDSLAP